MARFSLVGCTGVSQAVVPVMCRNAHNGQIWWGHIKGGLLPPLSLTFLILFFTSIVDLSKLEISLFLLCFLHLFEGKERGDLDLHSPPILLSSK